MEQTGTYKERISGKKGNCAYCRSLPFESQHSKFKLRS